MTPRAARHPGGSGSAGCSALSAGAAARRCSALRRCRRAARSSPLLGSTRSRARHGLTPAQQRACLSNQANLDRLDAITRVGHDQFGVTGTPTFFINGRTISDTNVWAGIEPLLRGR